MAHCPRIFAFSPCFTRLHAHTCCLRNRIQSLTHASRVTILSAFSKSLYRIHCATNCISYGLLRFCENCILRFLRPGVMVYLCQHISRSDYFSILFCFSFSAFLFSLFPLFPFYFFFSSLAFLMKAAFIIALQFLSCISYVPICSFIYANSEPQPNAKYSCAASVAIAR